MKNATKFNKKEVFIGAVSGAIAAVAGTIFSHILTKKGAKNDIEIVENENEFKPDESKYVKGFDASAGEDMSGNTVESEEN